MPRQQCETHEEQEQVRENHPLVLHVQGEPGEAGAELEARERELVDRDRREPGQRDLQAYDDGKPRPRAGSAEQDEIDRNAEKIKRRPRKFTRCRRGRRCDQTACHGKDEAEVAGAPLRITSLRTIVILGLLGRAEDTVPERAVTVASSTASWPLASTERMMAGMRKSRSLDVVVEIAHLAVRTMQDGQTGDLAVRALGPHARQRSC